MIGLLRAIPSKLALTGAILVALAGVGWFAWGEYQHQVERATTAESDLRDAQRLAAENELAANAWQEQAVRLKRTVDEREQAIADLQETARERQDEIDRIRESTVSADWAGDRLPHNVIEFVRGLTEARAGAGRDASRDDPGISDKPDTGASQ